MSSQSLQGHPCEPLCPLFIPITSPRNLPQRMLNFFFGPRYDREPTMLENFSRTVRNYVPSSIPIPTAAPSPPRVSRPVSFGSFMTTAGPMRIPTGNSGNDGHGYGYGVRGVRESEAFDYDHSTGRRVGPEREREHDRPAWSIDHSRDVPVLERTAASEARDEVRWPGRGDSRLPSASQVYSSQGFEQGDDILWAHWDVLSQGVNPDQQRWVHRAYFSLSTSRLSFHRRFLFLGYSSGLQIWDCTNLASVSEILNLPGQDWGYVSRACVLPRPTFGDDSLGAVRPVIGLV